MSNILWLASYPKSGNTWVRAFLANLIADGSDPLPLAELSNYCRDEAVPELFTALAGQPSTELDAAQLCALRPRVHARIAASQPGTVLVKTHNMNGSFEGHALHNPEVSAGAVYVVRNPLDVALSMTHHFGLSVDEAIDRLASEELATGNDELFVAQILGSWSMHVASWTAMADPAILTVRYEDMLEKPGKTFGKIAGLVGLGDNRKRIERAIAHSSFQSLSKLERRDGFSEASNKTTRFFRQGRANQWREALDRDQVARIVADHREQMARFKYIPKGY
ncbi:MAG: sulfotransferase domain-containing protein [Gammaproteobacteria bacterium]|nr:sulfotransferase domain-containing protein [Gammaproteobacteria bacterium]